jgi:hypothetical protein
MTDFDALLTTLAQHQVDFIVIGGAAAIAHGSARLTQDLDIVYGRSPENLIRLVAALASYKPYLRGAPPGLPFRWEPETLARGLLLRFGHVARRNRFAWRNSWSRDLQDLRDGAIGLQVFNTHCLCLSLAQLIRAKRAAGRPRDLETLAELNAIEEERS